MMLDQIVITGYGFTLGNTNEEQWCSKNFNHKEFTAQFNKLEKITGIDREIDNTLNEKLNQELQILPFNKKNHGRIKYFNPSSYHTYNTVEKALKKANLLKYKNKADISLIMNIMYPVFDFGNFDGIIPLRCQLEQQTPIHISSALGLQGLQFTHRSSDNADLKSIILASEYISSNPSNIFVIVGLSSYNQHFTRLEAYNELKSIFPYINSDNKYIIPTKYTNSVACIILESYSHAKKREAQIYGTLNNLFLEKYTVNYSSPSLIETSLSKLLKVYNTKLQKAGFNNRKSIVFANLNQNSIIDKCEYNALKETFEEIDIVCNSKLLGKCSPAFALLNIILALMYYQNNEYTLPTVSNYDELIEDNISYNQFIDRNSNEIIIQSLSKTGKYGCLTVSKPITNKNVK